MRNETTPRLRGSRSIGYGEIVTVYVVFHPTGPWFSLAAATWFVGVAGCGTVQPASGTGDDGWAPPGAPAPSSPPCGPGSGFQKPTVTWEVPREVASVEDRGSRVQWRLLDLDADGRPEFVALPEGGGDWLEVWPNTAAGFADTPWTWSLNFSPETLTPAPDDAWALVDLDGDGYTDIVDSRGPGSIGGTAWEIHRGGADGPQLGLWAIPFPTGQQVGGSGVVQWQPMDLDGDGPLDMVAVSGNLADGVRSWSWWPGGLAGFSSFERSWSIPRRLEGLRDPDIEPDWRIADLDGDGPVELMFADPQGGASWSVHKGSSTGFARTAAPVSIPVETRGVFDTRAVPQWRLLDFDGDGRLDFVTVGDEPGRWTVHFGVATDTGAFAFADDPVSWRLRFDADRVQDVAWRPQWRVIDFDGDGIVDLLRTTTQPDRWRINYGECVPPGESR